MFFLPDELTTFPVRAPDVGLLKAHRQTNSQGGQNQALHRKAPKTEGDFICWFIFIFFFQF